MHTLQLCNKLISTVESTSMLWELASQVYSVSEVVTYKYYVGKLKMYEDRYEESR
jgi:hypothetical protein